MLHNAKSPKRRLGRTIKMMVVAGTAVAIAGFGIGAAHADNFYYKGTYPTYFQCNLEGVKAMEQLDASRYGRSRAICTESKPNNWDLLIGETGVI
ncbi:MAG TPA: hypothetical protein VK453_04140 [Micromonosporaceae bacterium]|nr:hypothetical protein [Micromonosporaceae bacterium]